MVGIVIASLLAVVIVLIIIVNIKRNRKSMKVTDKIKKKNNKRRQRIINPIGIISINTRPPRRHMPYARNPPPQNEMLLLDFELEDLMLLHTIDDNNRMQYDDQNVHDTVIQRHLRNTYDELQDTKADHENNDDIEALLEQCPEKYKANVAKTLEVCTLRNNTMSGYQDKKETEILLDCFNKVKDNTDSLEAFYQNLSECVERGSVVCSTGVVSRAIDSLYINEPEKYPKTQNAIFQEMLSKASVLQKESPSEEEFQMKLKEAFTNDYQDVLTDEEIDVKYQEIINNV